MGSSGGGRRQPRPRDHADRGEARRDGESLCGGRSRGVPGETRGSGRLALYHSFRFNYPGVSGPVLVVDIGARSTNLLLVGPAGRFFARTFALAGNAVTAAMADELHLDFARAEALKIELSSGRPVVPGDAGAAVELQRATGNFLNRLQLEIMRTAGNFSCRTGAESPVAIYLTGGGSLLGDSPLRWRANSKSRWSATILCVGSNCPLAPKRPGRLLPRICWPKSRRAGGAGSREGGVESAATGDSRRAGLPPAPSLLGGCGHPADGGTHPATLAFPPECCDHFERTGAVQRAQLVSGAGDCRP